MNRCPPRRLPCQLCGEWNFQLISHRDRRGKFLRTVICVTCGLVRHWHVPTPEEIDAFYTARYRQVYHGEELPSDRRVFRAWRNGQRLLKRLSPFVSAGARVLEVGAGIGCTVKVFQEAGYHAQGIEPHVGFSFYAEHHIKANVLRDNLFSFTTKERYDLVLLVHVIEHLRDPGAALKRIRKWMQPGGLLYVECPNLAAPFAAPGKWFHFAHIYNFTPTTLSALAARSGWKVYRWLSNPRDTELAVLLRPGGTARATNYRDGYQEVMAALRRYSWWTYHLRLSYLRRRASKLAGYLWELIAARRFVQQLKKRNANRPIALGADRAA